MHICPHCVSQTLIWIVGVITTLPVIGIYGKYLLTKFRCKSDHTEDNHSHK